MTAYQLDEDLVKCDKIIKRLGWLSVGIVAIAGLMLIICEKL